MPQALEKPIRFATIGSDVETQAIARNLREQGAVWMLAAAPQFSPPVSSKIVEQWEDLLHREELDLIVVGAEPTENRDDQLRKLVQAGTPLLVVHPACEAIVAIELEMIRDDVGTCIHTYCPEKHHPAFQRLAKFIQVDSEVGSVEQIVMERTLPDRDARLVLWNLRRDCELLRCLAGRIRHVNAMGEAGKGAGFSNLSVNMTSVKDVVLRWSVKPGAPSTSITLIGEADTVSLQMGADQWQLRQANGIESYDPNEGRKDALAGLDKEPETDWTEIRHALEVAEAAERSAIKGKTIELYEESYTEEASFKGLMAIGGCGLLLFALLFAMVWSVVEGVRLPYQRNAYERARSANANNLVADSPPTETARTHILLRLWPVYPFVVFLLLQFLRLVFLSPRRPKSAESPPADLTS